MGETSAVGFRWCLMIFLALGLVEANIVLKDIPNSHKDVRSHIKVVKNWIFKKSSLK